MKKINEYAFGGFNYLCENYPGDRPENPVFFLKWFYEELNNQLLQNEDWENDCN